MPALSWNKHCRWTEGGKGNAGTGKEEEDGKDGRERNAVTVTAVVLAAGHFDSFIRFFIHNT